MRRVFWLAVGLGAGATAAVITSRWMKRQAQRLAPTNLAGQAVAGLGRVGDRLVDAWGAFRAGATEREAEIRSSLAS